MNRLEVWQGTQLLGALSTGRDGVRFRFAPAFVERVGLGRPIVSMSLPPASERSPIAPRAPSSTGCSRKVIDAVCTAVPAAMARAVAEVAEVAEVGEVPDRLAHLLADRVDAVARSA